MKLLAVHKLNIMILGFWTARSGQTMCIRLLLRANSVLISDQFCGQKYAHFSFFCKQMDIFLRKFYIFRKVTSAPTFLASLCDAHRTRQVLKIDLKSSTSFGHLVFYTNIVDLSWISCRLFSLKSFQDQFFENIFLFPLSWVKMWAPIANACFPWGKFC